MTQTEQNASAQREREAERASGSASASEGRAYKIDKRMLEEMLDAACHFGHKASKWNPKMRRFLYTKRDNIHIFDLTKTYECLMPALDLLRQKAAEGKQILCVSTKLQATRLVTATAQKCGISYVTRKWMPGLLTNFATLKRRIKYFRDLKTGKDSGEWDKYTKKERVELARTLTKLEDAFSGVEQMNSLPDVVLVFDAVRDALPLREAKHLGITTVGICDSNADPDLLTYPIPGNDDALKSLKFFLKHIEDAILAGKQELQERQPAQASHALKDQPSSQIASHESEQVV